MPDENVNTNSYFKAITEPLCVPAPPPAIILAGGYSMRMKEFKPLLPLGDATIIENTIQVFQQAGVKDITVVIGYRAEDLKAVLEPLRIKWVYNENYHQGMYSSVVVGVNSLSPNAGGFFLLPADMPIVKPGTIKELISVNNCGEYDIIYPIYNGHRGHPPLISASLFFPIKNWDGGDGGGLRALLSQYQNNVTHVEVNDEGILTDIDNPEDYKKLCKTFMQREVTA